MKSIVFVLLLMAGSSLQAAEPPVDVTVAVEGLRHTAGQLKVGLFGKDGFPRGETNALFGASEPVAGTNQTVTIPAVPPGEYAILVHHDENGNGKMDYDVLGRPREGWGVSGNIRHFFLAPAYREAAVTIRAGSTAFKVKLGY